MLFIMKGLPGSGKSRRAREMVKNADVLTLRVNMDDIRASMFPGLPFSKDREDAVASVRDILIRHGLSYGLDVISDDTNLNSRTFARVAAIADTCGSPVVVEDLTDVPLGTCLANNTGPNRTAVPETVIHRMWYNNISPFRLSKEQPSRHLDEDFFIDVYWSGDGWAWDLGCLTDSTLDVSAPLSEPEHMVACVKAWLALEKQRELLETEREQFVSDVLAES